MKSIKIIGSLILLFSMQSIVAQYGQGGYGQGGYGQGGMGQSGYGGNPNMQNQQRSQPKEPAIEETVKKELMQRGIESRTSPDGGVLFKDPNGLQIGISGKV